MNVLSKWATLVAVISVAYVAGNQANESSRGALAESIATVDMEAVITAHISARGDFDKLRDNMRSEGQALEAIRESIAGMQQEREIYAKNDPRSFNLAQAIVVEQKRYETQKQYLEYRFETERGKTVKLAYEKALGVIEAYAKEKNLSLVMLKTKPKFEDAETFQEVSNAIVVRSVVFGAQGIDITEEIEKRMK